jgi:pimeloyl-ACP methyl ester carboxylesterase
MLRKAAIGAAAALGLLAAAVSAQSAPESGYAPVNGLKMYYQIHGSGQPLVLLHGGVGAIEMFGPILPALSASHRVVAVDLQAHGRTADIDRPLRMELMADDVAALIRHLGIASADLLGYSLGGGVALQTAIRHPQAVRKLIVVSAPFKRDGWYPEVLAGMAQMSAEAADPMKQTPMYQLYAAVAPRPQDWPVLLAKIGEGLKQDYDWSREVAALPMPVLIVAGDADAVRTAHLVEFFALLGGGRRDAGWDGSGRPKAQLAILPGATHYDIFSRPELASVALRFLDSPILAGGPK